MVLPPGLQYVPNSHKTPVAFPLSNLVAVFVTTAGEGVVATSGRALLAASRVHVVRLNYNL